MIKFIVCIVCLIPFIMGFLGILGLGLAFFLPPEEKKVNITIEIEREDGD
ncbi:MAG: hypothetical protein K2M61_04270 [Muribaculaceae bacterium]|nr:hypothetical protein [Muribaculaceae bacterium]